MAFLFVSLNYTNGEEKENKLQAFQAEGLSSFRLIYIIHDCKRVFTSMRSDNRIRMQYRDMHVRE